MWRPRTIRPLRVPDADPEEVAVTPREHLLAGRLTLEEFSERVEAALRAPFGGELARVQADLPRICRLHHRRGQAEPGR